MGQPPVPTSVKTKERQSKRRRRRMGPVTSGHRARGSRPPLPLKRYSSPHLRSPQRLIPRRRLPLILLRPIQRPPTTPPFAHLRPRLRARRLVGHASRRPSTNHLPPPRWTLPWVLVHLHLRTEPDQGTSFARSLRRCVWRSATAGLGSSAQEEHLPRPRLLSAGPRIDAGPSSLRQTRSRRSLPLRRLESRGSSRRSRRRRRQGSYPARRPPRLASLGRAAAVSDGLVDTTLVLFLCPCYMPSF